MFCFILIKKTLQLIYKSKVYILIIIYNILVSHLRHKLNSDQSYFFFRECFFSGISRYDCPTGQIDVIGIMDQKSTGIPPNLDHTKGYRLLVLNYDGNGLVLGDTGHPRGNLPGDINNDYIVDFRDFAEFAENWLQNRAGLYGCGQ